MPARMLGQLASFVQLVRLVLGGRYDILDPKYSVRNSLCRRKKRVSRCATRRSPRAVLCVRNPRNIGILGVSALQMLFEKSRWGKLDAVADEYVARTKALKAYSEMLKTAEADFDHDAVLAYLHGLRKNNAQWLAAAAAQFSLFE